MAMPRRADGVRGLSFLDVHAQQQVYDLLGAVEQQKQLESLPRVENVRITKTSSGGSAHGVTLQLAVIRKNPESYSGAEEWLEISIRVPANYPSKHPMVACTSGTEKLPPSLVENGQLSLPWLRDGWPNDYTLKSLVLHLCAALGSSSSAPVHPLVAEVESPSDRWKPSAPTMHISQPRVEGDHIAFCNPPRSRSARKLLFKCKWRSYVCQFEAHASLCIKDFLQLARRQLTTLPDTSRLTIRVLRSQNEAKIIGDDEDWGQCCAHDDSVIHVLFEDLPGEPSPCRQLVDIAAHYQAQPESQVNPFFSPNNLRPRQVAWSVRKLNIVDFTQARREQPLTNPLFQEMSINECVGVGASCRVYKGTWRGAEIAAKCFTGTNRAAVAREFKNEVETMERLGSHPSLVLFIGICLEPLSIIFEYLPFSLFELINGVSDRSRRMPPFPASWTKRVSMMLDISRGLQFLHSFNIIHRDLKSLNLLMTAEGRVKLADFGISRVVNQSEFMTGCCGTFQWMAPEVITSQQYSLPADIYSLGIILWEICEAKAPFLDFPPAAIPIAVVSEKRRPPMSPRTPLPLQQLIQSCWDEQPTRRPTAAHVVDTLIGFFPKQ